MFGFREEKCTYTNCVAVGVLFDPALPSDVGVASLVEADPQLVNVTEIIPLGGGPGIPPNFTLTLLSFVGNCESL